MNSGLNDWVPADHLLREIDAILDLSNLRHQLGQFYSHTGLQSHRATLGSG